MAVVQDSPHPHLYAPHENKNAKTIHSPGASENDSDEDDDDAIYFHPDVADKSDDAVIHVDAALYDVLERETKKEAQRVTKLRPKQAKPISCKFCLFGSFRTAKAYSQHLQRDHIPITGSHKDFFQFAPLKMGGRKQLKLIKALFDDDALKKKVCGKYLERSTDYIRKILAGQKLPQRKSQYHRLLGLLLTAEGPKYFANLNANSSVGFRRIGYAYYDESFATAMFRESISNHGRFRPTYSAFVLSLIHI